MKNARFRRQEQAFIVEGWKMADEALVRGLVKSLYLSERAEGEYTKRQQSGKPAPTDGSVPVHIVSDRCFRDMADNTTC